MSFPVQRDPCNPSSTREDGKAKQRTAGNVMDQICGNFVILLNSLLLRAILYSVLEKWPEEVQEE